MQTLVLCRPLFFVFVACCAPRARVSGMQVHAYIIGYLRSQMPSMMGKEKAQKKLTAGECVSVVCV